AVLLRESHEIPEARHIAFHTENAFGDNYFRACAARVFAKRILEEMQIAVRINEFLRARESNPINQASVIQRVGEHNIARAHNGTQETHICGVSRTKVERRFRASKFCTF